MNKKHLIIAILGTLVVSSSVYAVGPVIDASNNGGGITANGLNTIPQPGLEDTTVGNNGIVGPSTTTINGNLINIGNNGIIPLNPPSLTTINGDVRIGDNTPNTNSTVAIIGDTSTVTGNTSATVTGGSTTMIFDNSGATLQNNIPANNNAPVQLHGIANGTAPNDAVNFSQLNTLEQKVDKNATRAFSGIAQIAAMQAIPAPIAGKNYSIGIGGGFYAGQQAMAFGGKANVGEHVNVSASVANGFGSNKDMAASVGAGLSW